MQINNEFYMKEYECLRQEIMTLVQASADLERWCVIGSAAILSFYFSEKIPRNVPGLLQTVRFLPCALVLLAGLINVRRQLQMRMIAAYIKDKIEPALALPGKGWENYKPPAILSYPQLILSYITWLLLILAAGSLIIFEPSALQGQSR